MIKFLKNLCCLAILILAQSVNAQDEINPVRLPDGIKIIGIGDQEPGIQGDIIYDNTTLTGFWLPPPAGAFPIEIADDVILPDPSLGTAHVNGFKFSYNQPNTASFDSVVNFYGALDPDGSDGPDQSSAVASFLLPGLPGGGIYTVTVDLAVGHADFDWPASTASDATSLNWVGFTFSDSGIGAGLLTATGGGSHDIFWSNRDLNPPYDSGGGNGYFWFFTGHFPEASFYMRILGYVN
ncbi:MAG TPA: hypothetical protein VGY77_01005 [Gemmataceae bacterium]|jgi:hypothetical protein|nr:hypothetical protein [Gemmataceae bacterium]